MIQEATTAMPCPPCLLKARNSTSVYNVDRKHEIDRAMSVVCNTWPPVTVPMNLEECCCGHPWLETAQEDYAAWVDGETDTEREERRGYPTIAEWRAQQNG